MADGNALDVLLQVLVENDAEILGRLRLSAAEAARVCGVTPRQLIYWTKKGLIRPSRDGQDDYDIHALEKVIRVRRALGQGLSLERAGQHVEHELAQQAAELERLVAMDGETLEGELRQRLERLEVRVSQLRHALPVAMTLVRLRRAVASLVRLESKGALNDPPGGAETAALLTARLGRAVDEIESLVREVEPAAV